MGKKETAGWTPPTDALVEESPITTPKPQQTNDSGWTPPEDAVAEEPVKKKDESESTSLDGSDSSEPAKPSEQSTKKPSLSENQDRIKKMYEFEYTDWRDKRQEALHDEFNTWAKTRLSEIQKQVDQDPSKVDGLNVLFKEEQKTKLEELDKTFNDEQGKKMSELDKDLNKFLKIQKTREEVKNPPHKSDVLESLVQTVYSGLSDQIPKEYYTQMLRMSKGKFGDLFDPYGDVLKTSAEDLLPKEINRDEFNQWNNALNSEDRSKSYDDKAKMFIIEKLGKPAFDRLKSEFLVKNEKDRLGFEKAIQEQNTQASKHLTGVVQDLRDVKGASDFLSFAGNMVGQALYRAPISIATGTAGSIMSESAAVYDQQLDLIAEKEGITRDEVIKKGLDKPAEGQALAVALGAMDAISAGTMLNIFKQAAKKELNKSVVKEFAKGFAKGAATEGITEGIQGEGEVFAASKGAGVDYKPDAWRIATAAVGGAIGGGVLSGSTSTNTDTKVEPSMQVDKVQLDQKIQDLVSTIDTNNVTPENAEAVANAIEQTVNTPVIDEKTQATIPTTESVDSKLIIPENTEEKAAPVQEPVSQEKPQIANEQPVTNTEQVNGSEDQGTDTSAGVTAVDGTSQDTIEPGTEIKTVGTEATEKQDSEKRKKIANEQIDELVKSGDLKRDGKNITVITDKGGKELGRIVEEQKIKYVEQNNAQESTSGADGVLQQSNNEGLQQSDQISQEGAVSTELPVSSATPSEIQGSEQNPIAQSGNGGVVPPTNNSSKQVTPPSEKQRKFSVQLLNDLDLNSAVRKGLSKDAITYVPKGIKISNDEARAIVETKGADAATVDFLDMSNGILPDVRVMLGENLIRKYNADENYDAAIKVADNLAMQLTDLGRGVNAAKAFSMLTPEGVIRYVQKEITKSRDKSSRDTAPQRKQSKKVVDDQNQKAITAILDPKSKTGKEITDKVKKGKVKQAIDFLEKLKIQQPKGMATAQIIPIAGLTIETWNLAINIIQKSLQAGYTIAQAVNKAIKKLQDEGHKVDENAMHSYFGEQLKEYKEAIDEANVKKDRETRYTPQITRAEKDAAVDKISELLLPTKGKEVTVKPAIQQFYDRVVQRMAGGNPSMKNKSADQIWKEITTNLDKYADVLQGVKDDLQGQGVDVSDVESIFDLPYFKKQLEKKTSDDIDKIIRMHYSDAESAKTSLAEKLVKEANIPEEQAAEIQALVKKSIDEITREAKKKALKKYLPKAKKAQDQKRTNLIDELIEASNLGAMDEEVYRDAISQKLGPEPITAEQGQEIKKLADRIQKAKSDFDRNKAQEDLIRYIDKNVKGIRWTDVGMSIWYANVLSGLSTQLQNLYGNLSNTLSEAYVSLALNPKEAGFIFKGLFSGYGRGLLEAMDTVKSGYQPIKGDVKQISGSPVLESIKFKGGPWNPYNHLKYVTRLMAATDIFFYHGLKEMRSRELAVAIAKKENAVNPSGSVIAQAKKQLYGEEKAWNDAQEQAELEGYTGKEKTRRAYELLEKSRPEFINEDSSDFALRGTYNNQPEGALGMLSGVINMASEKLNIGGVKPIKFIVPFTRIIANVANTALDYSPWAFGRYAKGKIGYEGFGENYYHKYTQEEKSKLLVKGITGTIAMAALAALTDDDDGIFEITADGTGDTQKNFELQETGWQPYSIKMGDTWYEYRNTPLAIPFAMVGYWRDGQKYKGKADDDMMTRLSILTYGTLKYIMDLSFLQSLSGFFDSFSKEKTASGKNYFEKASSGTEKVLKSFVVPNAFTQASRSMQEIMELPQKQVNQIGNLMIRDMPVLRDRLDNMYNSLGDPVIPNQVSKFLPFKLKSEPTGKDKELYDLIADNNAWISKPGRTVIKISNGESMTDEEFEQFCFVAGKATKAKLLENIVELRSMKNGEEIKDFIRKLKVQARREANIQLFGEKSYF